MWCDFVTLNDKEMRKWLKLPEVETGIRFVRQPIPIPNYPLKLNDVVARIGEFDVSNLGKVDYNENIQVSFEYAVDQSAKDGHIEMRIFRAGTEMHIQVPVLEDGRFLLQHLNDRTPSNFRIWCRQR